MSQFINGPINYVELSGTINGIEKHITFFMDTHYALDKQTRCETFDSIDIAQYLYKTIKEATCPLDFFMEIKEKNINEPRTNKKNIYIKEVMEMFKSEIIVEKEVDRNLVKYAKSNQNVRLHYLDIRDHFNMFKLMEIVTSKIKPNLELLLETDNYEYKNNIFEYFKIIKADIANLKINLINALKNDNFYNKIEEKDKYYMDKIINRFENHELRHNIIIFIIKYFNRIEQIFNEVMKELNLLIKKFKPIEIKELKRLIDFLYEMIIDLYSIFTDGFLLRRILDKKYIGTSIVYSGSQHAINCIGFLVKFCDFKIKKVHSSKIENLDELMDVIKNTEYIYNISKYFYQKNKKYTQCVKYDDYILSMLPHICK